MREGCYGIFMVPVPASYTFMQPSKRDHRPPEGRVISTVSRPKILIVEDEADILDVLEYTFSREGYRVLSTRDGGDAVDIARRESPRLILLDLMLVYWMFLQLLGSVPTLTGAASGGGVAFVAHLGGFVAGAALIKLFAKRELVEAHRARRRVRFRQFSGDGW